MKITIIAAVIGLALSGVAGAEESSPSFPPNSDLMNVHNRCIVRLGDHFEGSHIIGIARALAAQANSSLRHIYSHSIKGFAINLPCAAAAIAFGNNPDVISLTPDSVVSINKGKPPRDGGGGGNSDPQQISYGTERVGGSTDGTGLTAWIIDTGIDLNHPDLNVDSGRGFTVFGGKSPKNDQNGHGTHVAGTIAAKDNGVGSLGVAQGATVIPVRVLDRRGSGTVSGVIAGVDHVAANAFPGDCANMSLGGGVSQPLDDAVIAASVASGAFFALAAGNSGDDASNHSPARVNGSNVWTISAVDEDDVMPSWSNYGTPVDFAAPGVDIFSLWKDGGTNTISGTSMAAPHACAVLMVTGGFPNSNGTATGDPDGNSDPIIHLQ